MSLVWAPVDNLDGNHGYDVLATLAAKLDATVPTGANPFPDCLTLKALQIGTLGDVLAVITGDRSGAAGRRGRPS